MVVPRPSLHPKSTDPEFQGALLTTIAAESPLGKQREPPADKFPWLQRRTDTKWIYEIEDDDDEQQKRSLAATVMNALATICAQRNPTPVYAVALFGSDPNNVLVLPKDAPAQPTLLITRNKPRDSNKVAKHLQEVWKKLLQCGNTPAETRESARVIGDKVSQFCFSKVYHRIMGHGKGQAMIVAIDELLEKPNLTKPQQEGLLDMKNTWVALVRYLSSGALDPESGHPERQSWLNGSVEPPMEIVQPICQKLTIFIVSMHKRGTSVIITDLESGTGSFVHLCDNMVALSITRGGLVKANKPKPGVKYTYSFKKYVGKVVSYFNTVNSLCFWTTSKDFDKLTNGRTVGLLKIIEREGTAPGVVPSTGPVEQPPFDANLFHPDYVALVPEQLRETTRNWAEGKVRCKHDDTSFKVAIQNTQVHCECAVLQFLFQLPGAMDKMFYQYVGVSKLSCPPCATAYHVVNLWLRYRGLPTISTTGAHLSATIPWTFPDLAGAPFLQANDIPATEIENSLTRCLQDVVEWMGEGGEGAVTAAASSGGHKRSDSTSTNQSDPDGKFFDEIWGEP